MTDNFRKSSSGRSITLEVPNVETPQESLDRLRLEVEELRASRERLVLAADADRRRIERDLHEGVQQHVVALAVSLEPEPPARKRLSKSREVDPQCGGASGRILAQSS